MVDELVTPNFWLSEFLQSTTAVRRGFDNTPKATELANIRNLLIPGMQSVRDCLGSPVFITSGYRSRAVNAAVRGSASSQHCQGLAADFKAPAFGMPSQIVKHLMGRHPQVRYDQLICEGEWVHVSFSTIPRGQVLTAHFVGDGVTYTPGVS